MKEGVRHQRRDDSHIRCKHSCDGEQNVPRGSMQGNVGNACTAAGKGGGKSRRHPEPLHLPKKREVSTTAARTDSYYYQD